MREQGTEETRGAEVWGDLTSWQEGTDVVEATSSATVLSARYVLSFTAAVPRRS